MTWKKKAGITNERIVTRKTDSLNSDEYSLQS